MDEKARWKESALIAARAAEAYALAGEDDRAREVFSSIQRLASLDEDTIIEVARSAMVSAHPEFVRELLAGEQAHPTLRLLRADAQSMADDAAVRALGAETLTALLDDAEPDMREAAAFALTAAASAHRDVSWDDRAAELLAPSHAAGLAMLHAEHLRLHDDLAGAERELLAHNTHPRVRRLLRDLAAQREDWATAKDRSRAVMRDQPTDRDRIIDAEILRQAGDIPEATARFSALAGDQQIAAELREAAHQSLVTIALDDRDYPHARDRARAWLAAFPASDAAAWNLLYTLVRQHNYTGALTLWRERSPHPDTVQQAQLAAEILHRAAPREDAIREIDQLSRRFERREEPLEGMLLVTALAAGQEGVRLPEDLRAAVGEAFARFPTQFPDSAVIRTVEAPSTAEELDEFLRDAHGDSAEAQRAFFDEIRDGSTAVSIFAAVAGGDVAGAWGRLTFLPLGFADPQLDAHELTIAREAIGAAAVWDGSSLFVARSLPDELTAAIVQALPGSMIANTTYDDIDAAIARLPAAGSPQMTVGYDPVAGRGFAHETSAEDVARLRERMLAIHALASELDARPGTGSHADPRLAGIVTDEHGRLPFRTLAETLLLAQREDRPIYSDDRWIPPLGRELRCPGVRHARAVGRPGRTLT